MSALCLSCGVCCDGTLFATAPLAPGEAARLAERVSVLDADTMEFPCRALDGVRCTIYDDRPRICREFNCLVLAELAAGRITEEEARAFIDEVLTRRRALADAMGLTDDAGALREARALAKANALEPAALAALERLTRALMFLKLPLPG
ncbi:MAG: YkgJ family cysteine cluster protein [Myxococcaceae bacterium]|nr:YkgJ family cysteine cluster protein [Myxococcaceae bacterium]